MNALKTTLLLGLLTGVLVVGGGILAGQNGLYLGLAMAVVMNFTSYFFSERIALMSYSAQQVTPTENADVYRRVEPIVRGLAHKMDIPMPQALDDSRSLAQRLCHRPQPASMPP